jgi:hypothetical protein
MRLTVVVAAAFVVAGGAAFGGDWVFGARSGSGEAAEETRCVASAGGMEVRGVERSPDLVLEWGRG